MAKRSLGIFVLSCGGVVGLVTGGTFGLVTAAACLVAGVLILATGDRGPAQRPRTQGLLLVLVKELHARPIRNGKFHEISDPKETVQFELFARCWLVSKVLSPVNITAVQLRVTRPNNSVGEPDRVPDDLQNWRLGKLTEEEDSTGIRRLKTANEEMPPLDLINPLLTGVAREGWLHYKDQNISPSELKAASIELFVTDHTGAVHHGGILGQRVIPGRVWPFAQASLIDDSTPKNPEVA
jgi:hypothetical protein